MVLYKSFIAKFRVLTFDKNCCLPLFQYYWECYMNDWRWRLHDLVAKGFLRCNCGIITRLTFHTHNRGVIYPRTITRDVKMPREDANFVKFCSKIVRFCHFSWKVIRQPLFIILFRYYEVCKICENQKN